MLLTVMGAIFAAGAVGGMINAWISDNGFLLPNYEPVTEDGYQSALLRPGFLMNVFIGGIAAIVSWGLYGRFATATLLGAAAAGSNAPLAIGLQASELASALLLGIAGAKWLTNEADKRLLKAAASIAANKAADGGASRQIATASPAQALEVARDMKSA
jgi:hypothetical protein